MYTSSQRLGSGIYATVGSYAAIIYSVLLIFPAITGQLIDKYGINAESLGLLASVEMGGLSLATVPAYLWLTKVDPRRIVVALSLVMILGNVYSAFAPSFSHLCVARVVTGAAAGSIAVVLLALSRRAPDSGKSLGVFVTAQLVMAAAMLAVYPYVFGKLGLTGLYLALAGLTALAMLTTRAICRNRLTPIKTGQSETAGRRAPRHRVVAGLAAITLFYVCLGGVWAFVGVVAEEGGISATNSSTILAVATAAGIASAALATAIGETRRRTLYMTLGLVFMVVSVVAFVGTPETWRYSLAAVLFKFAWTFTLPFMLAGLAALPGGDNVMNTTNLMLGIGSTAGPYLAGFWISRMGGMDSMLLAAAVGLIVTIGCALVLESRSRQSSLPVAQEEAA
ncbi:MFS transporter [Sinosporangium siamense]|uniref:MFS transporter n=1 Tax=Sinosporangium siamense TaxID=1367973 RepID=A0A919RIB8_9ACTN|nr:MFS transporter [Sinosporangium siamense]GII92909.1 MFS transporter [Sinosporangium siamense]